MDKLDRSEGEWRERLSPEEFEVTRKAGTERPFTHDDFPKGAATFACVCCGQPLFDAEHKYDSGTGWPSFYKPVAPEAVKEREDRGGFATRTEIVCARCEAHLGHVFDDGPEPTGLRYCMNGVALRHEPKA
jgi:peptide-methionine (R)-S-oxide reductase